MMVTRLGFGGIPIQRCTEAEAVKVVRKCFELGINFFDTANGYSTSEERIGKALKEIEVRQAGTLAVFQIQHRVVRSNRDHAGNQHYQVRFEGHVFAQQGVLGRDLQQAARSRFHPGDLGLVQALDPESGKTYWTDAGSESFRRAYRQWWQTHEEEWDRAMRRAGCDNESLATDGDFVKPLVSMFRKREVRQ